MSSISPESKALHAEPRRLLQAVIALTVFALLLCSGGFARYRYTERSERYCLSCHTRSASQSWHPDEHQSLKCQDCHQTPAVAKTELSVLSLLGKSSRLPKHGVVTQMNCVTCHAKDKAWQAIEAKGGGHFTHAKVKDLTCLSCHSSHTQRSADAGCTPKCHQRVTLHPKTPSADTCLTCHSFAGSARGLARNASRDCRHCHGDSAPPGASGKFPAVSTQVLHGKSECGGCHEPHGKRPLSRTNATGTSCQSCHDLAKTGFGPTELKVMPDGHKVCSDCHEEHAPLKTATSTCHLCHEDYARATTAPNSAAAKLAKATRRAPGVRAKATKTSDAAQANGASTMALRHESCATCHQAHAFKTNPNGCIECHQKEDSQIRSKSPKQHSPCDACHKSHSTATAASFCGDCHAQVRSQSASASPRHSSCSTCHLPHSATSANARGACLSCHKPIVELPVHRGSCNQCHATHGSAATPRPVCLKCHDSKIHFKAPPNAKHSNCSTCHQSHVAAKLAAQTCNGCHGAQAQIAQKWPANTAHSQACGKCHSSHQTGVLVATCASCHAKAAAGSKGDRHKCKDCHAAHEAPPGTGAAWWTRCQKCHARETNAVKSRGPVHSNCSKCHESHRFASASCNACHADVRTKGGHAIKEHSRCRTCHDSHNKNAIMRANCLGACHKDQRNHEVDGPRCQACHGFQ